jgi:hypothetical protein
VSCYICSSPGATFMPGFDNAVCERPDCRDRTLVLPPWHCQWRDTSGELCGHAAGAVLGQHGRALCHAHLRAELLA